MLALKKASFFKSFSNVLKYLFGILEPTSPEKTLRAFQALDLAGT